MVDPEFVNIFNKLHVFISLSFYSLYNISIGGDDMFHFAIVGNTPFDIKLPHLNGIEFASKINKKYQEYKMYGNL
jgi:hypothetical protein